MPTEANYVHFPSEIDTVCEHDVETLKAPMGLLLANPMGGSTAPSLAASIDAAVATARVLASSTHANATTSHKLDGGDVKGEGTSGSEDADSASEDGGVVAVAPTDARPRSPRGADAETGVL